MSPSPTPRDTEPVLSLPPAIVIYWDYTGTDVVLNDIRDVHLYVQTNGAGAYEHLGHTGNASNQAFVWKADSPLVSEAFRAGPDMENAYQFLIYVTTISLDPPLYGPLDIANRVELFPLGNVVIEQRVVFPVP